MSEEDRQDLQQFLRELRELMDDVSIETRTPGLLSPARRQALRRSVEGLQDSFTAVIDALNNPTLETAPVPPGRMSLQDVRLLGPDREDKVDGWRRGLTKFRDWVSRKTLRRPLRWANTILGSLSAVIPLSEALKELKEITENLIEDADEDANDAG